MKKYLRMAALGVFLMLLGPSADGIILCLKCANQVCDEGGGRTECREGNGLCAAWGDCTAQTTITP